MALVEWLVVGFAAAYVALRTYWLVRHHDWKLYVFEILSLALLGGLLYIQFGWFQGSSPSSKAAEDTDETLRLIALFVCMLAGMLAQYVYGRLSQPKGSRPPFDVGLFFAPALISPIIFLPLYFGMRTTWDTGSTKYLACLVAYENGFFFKNTFDQRRAAYASRKKKGTNSQPPQ